VVGDVRLPSTDETEPEPRATVLAVTDDELARYGAQPGRLTTTLHYALQRSRVIGTLPLADGASVDAPSMRIQIVRVQRRSDSCEVLIRQWQIASILSPPEFPHYDFVLRNLARREAFTGNSRQSHHAVSSGSAVLLGMTALWRGGVVGYGPSGREGFSLRHVWLEYPQRWPGQIPRPTVDTSWLDAADLVIVEAIGAGVVTRTVTLEDFRMREPQ
jgi:hypothetical protein